MVNQEQFSQKGLEKVFELTTQAFDVATVEEINKDIGWSPLPGIEFRICDGSWNTLYHVEGIYFGEDYDPIHGGRYGWLHGSISSYVDADNQLNLDFVEEYNVGLDLESSS